MTSRSLLSHGFLFASCAAAFLSACATPTADLDEPATVGDSEGSVVVGKDDRLAIRSAPATGGGFTYTTVPFGAPGSESKPLDPSYVSALEAIGRTGGYMVFSNGVRAEQKGTATHVGGGLVVTAGHVVTDNGVIPAQVAPAGKTLADCRGVVISFGETADSRPERQFKRNTVETIRCRRVVALSFSQSQGLVDYAVLELEEIPKAAIPLRTAAPTRGEALTVISHPMGKPAALSTGCSITSPVANGTFQHDCDTEGGSSGATLLVRNKNAWSVVGIHNGNSRLIGGSGVQNAATTLGLLPASALTGASRI
jgi:V8-like Glu-specific endopeptidase